MLGSLGPMHGRVNGGGRAEVILTTVELLELCAQLLAIKMLLFWVDLWTG